MAKKQAAKQSKVEVPQMKETIEIKGNIYQRLTQKQQCFLEDVSQPNTRIMFINGPAGTSKTYLSILHALEVLKDNDDAEILYVRTNAESGDSKMGTLPGNEEEKLSPFLIPLQDKLEEMLKYETVKSLTCGPDPRVKATAVNYLRGASWKNKIVIADEAQNFTFGELITLITRIGRGTKLIICGDFMQSDIRRSGFRRMFGIFDKQESRRKGVGTFTFTKEDIVRDKFLQYVIGEIENNLEQNSE